MSRPRKPTKTLELNGAFKRHPGRKRINEPQPAGLIGDPPAHFISDELKATWHEIINMTPEGVLTDADRIHLEIMCQLLVDFRNNPIEFQSARLTRLEAMFGKVGLNPADRSKVTVPGPNKANPFNNI